MKYEAEVHSYKAPFTIATIGMMGAICLCVHGGEVEKATVIADKCHVSKLTATESKSVTGTAVLDRPKFVPSTPLAKRLWAIKQKAIAEGLVLRPAEEIIEEFLASRRG